MQTFYVAETMSRMQKSSITKPNKKSTLRKNGSAVKKSSSTSPQNSSVGKSPIKSPTPNSSISKSPVKSPAPNSSRGSKSQVNSPKTSSKSPVRSSKPAGKLATPTKVKCRAGGPKPIRYPRYKYSRHWDFLFSSVGATVGFGNIFRFPALAAEHGGLSFLCVCLVYACFIGVPLSSLEMFFGQLSGFGIGKTMRMMSPLFQGVGWSMICMAYLQSIQYGVLIAYCFIYFVTSFRGTLWWSLCNMYWNTDACLPITSFHSFSDNITASNGTPISSTEEFYFNFVLGDDPGKVVTYGEMSWMLSTSLLFAWFMVCACLVFGIKISSKLAYGTVIFPYMAMSLMFFACLSQTGAADGLKTFFMPQYSNIVSKEIWIDAVSHVIWSLNQGSGVITAMTSYNPFYNDCRRDAFIIVLLDISTSFIAGMTVFAGTGIISKDVENEITVQYLQKYGKMLAFVVYPEILSRMKLAPLWSLLFFLMVIILALDTEIWLVETCLTEVADVYLRFRSKWYRVGIVGAFCSISYLISLIFCLKKFGAINFAVLANFLSSYIIVLLAFLESAVVVFVYGYNRFARDLCLILGSSPNLFWRIAFLITVPGTLFGLLMVKAFSSSPVLYRNVNQSLDLHLFSVISLAIVTCLILVFALYWMIKCCWLKKPLEWLIAPSKQWCPRKKADLENQRQEIEKAEEGLMGEFELSIDSTTKIHEANNA